jgi:hypothetical protein
MMKLILSGTALAALLALAVPAAAQTQKSGDIPPSPSVDLNSKPGKPAKPGTEAGVTATTSGIETAGKKPKVAERDKSGVAAQTGTEAGPAPHPGGSQSAMNGGMSGGHASRDEAMHAQQALKAENLYHGNIDGIIGPKTREALAQFQKQQGLKQTSALDPATMQALGHARTTASGSSTPPSSGSGSGGRSRH